MSASSPRARHRAARRPLTPLDDFALAATGSVAVVGRRAGVAAASSGLLVSMLGAAPASAAPAGDVSVLPSVDTASLAETALSSLSTGPVVTVDADAEWTFDIPKVTVVKEPEPEPVRRAVAAPASRTTERSSNSSTSSSKDKPAKNGNKIPAAVAGNEVLEIAARYVGVPYVAGGSSPKGFDCSGFTQYVFKQLGISLPRTTSGQKGAGTIVSREDAKPGDIIWSPGHVGIYAGGNKQIDAPRQGKTIQFRKIWQSRPVFIRVTG